MTHPWDEIWPVSEPPPEFALQVLVASAKQPTARWRKVALLLAALVPCLVLGVGAIAVRQNQEQAARRAVILETQHKETEERLRRLQAEFDAASRKEQELQASLASAKDEVTRSRLQAELETQKATSKAIARSVMGGARSAIKPKPSASVRACPPADPLCNP